MTASVISYRPSVGILETVGRAWRGLVDQAAELWPLLPPWTAAVILNGVMGHAVKLSGQDGAFAPLNLGRLVVSALTGALLSGVTIRILLGRGRDAWRPDRDLGAFVLVTMVIDLMTSLPDLLMTKLVHPTAGQALERLGDVVGTGITTLALTALFALWPIAQLMGDRHAGPYESMQRMKGGVWTFWIATLLAILPTLIVGSILDWPYVRHGQVIGLFLSAPFLAVGALTATAVQAEIFRARWVRD
jgi:hypothetical protein